MVKFLVMVTDPSKNVLKLISGHNKKEEATGSCNTLNDLFEDSDKEAHVIPVPEQEGIATSNTEIRQKKRRKTKKPPAQPTLTVTNAGQQQKFRKPKLGEIPPTEARDAEDPVEGGAFS